MVKTSSYCPVQERRKRVLPVRGVDYVINEWGNPDAPLLFFLHGWADMGSTFQFTVDALSREWHVVAPDWRGFGRSDCRAHSYWFPDYLADLYEIIEHYSPAEPVRLIGHSMGGNVATLFAGSFVERVSQVVNVEGFGLPDSNPADAPDRYRQWIEAGRNPPVFMRYDSYATLAARIVKRNPKVAPEHAEFVAREWARDDNGKVRLRADPSHKLPNPVLYRRAEALACCSNTRASVLFISGETSPFAGARGDEMLAATPHARAVVIPGTGHMIHFEAPAALAGEIEAFLT